MKTIKQFLRESKQINEAFSDDEIMKWLEKYDENFKKNTYDIKNGVVDVYGKVKLKRVKGEIPFQFGKMWHFNFVFGSNDLTSLKGCPEKVETDFLCAGIKLKSLKGAPQEVGGDFMCYDNNLTSLEGSPKKIGGNFSCGANYLTTLKGAPKEVKGDFECQFNKVQFTEEDVRKVCKVSGKIVV